MINMNICGNAYLAIHGFGGGPEEVQYLVSYLQGQGLDAHSVLLAGHGASKRELSVVSHNDWINSAQEAVLNLLRSRARVSLLGFSMGGLIALHLARMPGVDKLVFINTPIFFWNPKVIAKDLHDGICRGKREVLKKYKESIFKTSLKTEIDFLRILSSSKRLLCTARNASLVLQCSDDESVRPKSAAYIAKNLGGTAELKYYKGGRHRVFLIEDTLRDTVCGDILRFLT